MVDGGAAPSVDGRPRLAAIVEEARGGEAVGGRGADPASPTLAAPAPPPRVPPLGRGGLVWKVLFVGALLVAVVAIPVLTLVGKAAVEESTSGRVIGVVSDPTAPGYEVLVEPTPTLLLVQTRGEQLQAATFLSRSSETTGSALFLPPNLAVDLPTGPATLRDAWEDDGEAGVVAAVEALLGVGIAEYGEDGTLLGGGNLVPFVRFDTTQWEQVVAPVAPLTIENPAPLSVLDEGGQVVAAFPAGELRLSAEEVGPYLEARAPGEVDLNRMERHALLWSAWIDAVRRVGPDAGIAGEQDSGLGRYVRTFAEGEAGFVPVQAAPYRVFGADEELYVADAEVLGRQVALMVPFPTAPTPGSRPAVEVFDGTGTPDVSVAVAERLARDAGAEIRAIGNGPNFAYAETHILYYDPAGEDAARAVRDTLGAGRVELRPNPDEVATVTVILGTDVVDGLEP